MSFMSLERMIFDIIASSKAQNLKSSMHKINKPLLHMSFGRNQDQESSHNNLDYNSKAYQSALMVSLDLQ